MLTYFRQRRFSKDDRADRTAFRCQIFENFKQRVIAQDEINNEKEEIKMAKIAVLVMEQLVPE